MNEQIELLIEEMEFDCKEYQNIQTDNIEFHKGWYQATKFWLGILKKITKEKK